MHTLLPTPIPRSMRESQGRVDHRGRADVHCCRSVQGVIKESHDKDGEAAKAGGFACNPNEKAIGDQEGKQVLTRCSLWRAFALEMLVCDWPNTIQTSTVAVAVTLRISGRDSAIKILCQQPTSFAVFAHFIMRQSTSLHCRAERERQACASLHTFSCDFTEAEETRRHRKKVGDVRRDHTEVGLSHSRASQGTADRGHGGQR